jgi:putative SOS response-associated peptidase YedK
MNAPVVVIDANGSAGYATMCARFTLSVPAADIAEMLRLMALPKLTPRYNIAPTQSVLAVRLGPTGEREPVFLRWGLVPAWSDDPKIGHRLLNARSETAAQKPAFRDAFRKRRCVIPADGFFEWRAEKRKKQPYLFRRTDGKPFVFASLWERNERLNEAPLETCTILTTTANDLMRPFHDRMPVILTADQVTDWLASAPDPGDLKPIANDFLIETAVDPVVNSPRNDDPRCIAPVRRESPDLFG